MKTNKTTNGAAVSKTEAASKKSTPKKIKVMPGTGSNGRPPKTLKKEIT